MYLVHGNLIATRLAVPVLEGAYRLYRRGNPLRPICSRQGICGVRNQTAAVAAPL